MDKKAQTDFIRNVIIAVILIVVLLIIVAIASGQATKWIDYLIGILGL